jgi:hypothetical protein
MYERWNVTTVRPGAVEGLLTVLTSVYVTVPYRVRLVPVAADGASFTNVAEFSLKS